VSASSVHAEHDVYLYEPLRAGQQVSWDCSLLAMHQTPAGALSTQQIIVRDLHGRPLIEHRWSTMSIKATSRVTGGPVGADHTFPESARSHPIGGGRPSSSRSTRARSTPTPRATTWATR
jgi:hypothetical protein